MKYIKILALMVGLVSLASCSSNDDDKRSLNTNGGVYVSMEDTELTFKENKGVVTIPFVITGERNGYISVTCTVEEYISQGFEPAMEDVHYLLSGETVTVWEDDNSGNFEIRLVDDNIMNDPRMFVIKLASAEGCEINGITETYITIKDNDQDPYDRLSGTWKVYNAAGAPQSEITLKEFDEGEYGYKRYYNLVLTLNGTWNTSPELIMNYTCTNEETGEGYLSFNYAKQDTGIAENSDGTSTETYVNYELSLTNGSGVVELEWSEDCSEVYVTKTPTSTTDEANPEANIYALAVIGNYGYIWAYVEDMATLKR